MDKAISKGHLIMKINHTTVNNLLPYSMEEYNSTRERSTIPLENVSQVDQGSGSLDDYNEDNIKNDINDVDCNSNCNTQGPLDDLHHTQEKFAFEKIEEISLYAKVPKVLVQWADYDVPTWEPLVLMFPQVANDIACHAAEKNK
eukprot:2582879-Ditylum_brightwellii.AAC.1